MNIEKHLVNVTFKFTFLNTNVTESDCILQKKYKKQKDQSFSLTLSLKPIFLFQIRDKYRNGFQ